MIPAQTTQTARPAIVPRPPCDRANPHAEPEILSGSSHLKLGGARTPMLRDDEQTAKAPAGAEPDEAALGSVVFTRRQACRSPLAARAGHHQIHLVLTQCPRLRIEGQAAFDASPGILVLCTAQERAPLVTDRAYGVLTVAVPADRLTLPMRGEPFRYDALLRLFLQRSHEAVRTGGDPFDEGVFCEMIQTVLAGWLADTGAKGQGGASIQAVLTRIEEGIDGPLRIKSLIAASGLPRGQFYAVFQETVGMTPHAYLLHRRVDRARELIEASDVSLAEVAAACGFASQSHLTDSFRKQLGITPGRYRDRCRPTAAAR